MIVSERLEPTAAHAGTLRHDLLPMRLYHDAKRLGTWDPQSLDLRRDVVDWGGFTVAERDVLLRLTVLFQAAEETMTRDLLPLILTVAREHRLEEELFLTAFLAEEAKHTEFFRRVLDEVCHQSGDLQRYQTPSFRRLFAEQLPLAMQRLLSDPSAVAQAEALVTYALVGEGVLGDAGYHLFSTALTAGDLMPGFRDGLARAQADEARHITYGMYVLSRLVTADADVWGAVSRRLEDLLPLTLGIVSEFFAAYDPMPFGLTLEETIQDATGRLAGRWAALEEARERGRARAAAPEANETVRAVLGWVGKQLQPLPVELRHEGANPVYTFHIGPTGAAVLLITQEVLGQYASTDIIAALGAHRVPERLRVGGRTRLTCLSARGKMIVQPVE
ncbi:MAG TPA: R2-like ligand-binding oxidase [Gemmatimonadales bacterium]|jgi:ribonucleoside-diphosphate reductase beta chain|nr:R2-like ligand-binding oxidase [Gemmatimonadales bacterium]